MPVPGGMFAIEHNPAREAGRLAGNEERRAQIVDLVRRQGFVSIGCAPCTRAIAPGEDARAGRWWWESSGKECGLHR